MSVSRPKRGMCLTIQRSPEGVLGMYPRLRGLVLPLIVSALVALPLSLGTVHAQTQTQMDVPTLTLVDADRSSIKIQITAGASGAPAGVNVYWVTKADFDANGGWPASEYDPVVVWCYFTGTPTLTVTPGVEDYRLAPGESYVVEVGDLFDETGVNANSFDELPAGSEFVFRAYTNGSGGLLKSDYTADVFASTDPPGADCVLTQGFWKTHAEAWPVNSLEIGCHVYTKQELLDILNTPAGGNGAIFLAHQLIAAKLNIANGASPAPVAAEIAAADDLLCNMGDLLPPIGAGYIAPKDASDLTEVLDEYNNGNSGVEHCDIVPTTESTWGAMKNMYR